jgi:uncharacterized protein (TIGR02145 family)
MKKNHQFGLLSLPSIGAVILFAAVLVFSGCSKDWNPAGQPFETGTVTDADGNTYRTVKIGDQWWMAENLKVTHYRNGDAIPDVTDGADWSILTTGAYCNYNDDIDNVAACGRLYNWYAAVDNRNIAFPGWHMPSDVEWQTLVNCLGGDSLAGGRLKAAGTTRWQSPNTGATNESGFSALPGGCRFVSGSFIYSGYCAFFWTSTEYDLDAGMARGLGYVNSDIARGTNGMSKQEGLSVRLISD